MKVFEVNIYIETSIKSPKAGKAAGMWLIEFITSSDVPVTRSGMITERNTTENALVLKLLTEAFRRLTKTCLVSVNTECGHVLSVVNNGWLPGWEIGGWINKKRQTGGQQGTVAGAVHPHEKTFCGIQERMACL